MYCFADESNGFLVNFLFLFRWEETVEKLVLIGIDVNAKNDVDMTALHYAAVSASRRRLEMDMSPASMDVSLAQKLCAEPGRLMKSTLRVLYRQNCCRPFIAWIESARMG